MWHPHCRCEQQEHLSTRGVPFAKLQQSSSQDGICDAPLGLVVNQRHAHHLRDAVDGVSRLWRLDTVPAAKSWLHVIGGGSAEATKRLFSRLFQQLAAPGVSSANWLQGDIRAEQKGGRNDTARC
ncbi:hypothetical protein [Mesorhizobium argentiipisi]|uniref:Uncharacterized protein n=1 Tax=Mesorhizobium argentiipisi TaxID=3015175 RepID=A0ABU8KDJ2_9HYPH